MSGRAVDHDAETHMGKVLMQRTLRVLALLLATSLTAASGHPQEGTQAPPVPVTPASIRFAVIGDSGTGEAAQFAVAKQMVTEYDRSPFPFVLMLGDNLYGGNWSKRYKLVFEEPYRPLLDRGVFFYATLGNHDQASAKEQTKYQHFNMDGNSRYNFKPAGDLVEFFTFNSSPLSERGDTSELGWLDQALADSKANWKIVFCHHPPYSPGKRHGDDKILVAKLVPILQKHGVRVVMTGHEHFFASLPNIDGISYLISGSAGKIHKGGLNPKDPRLESGNDKMHHFLSVTLTADELTYAVIDGTGAVLFRGTIPRVQSAAAAGGTRT